MKKQRIKYSIVFIILVCIEFLIAVFIHDTLIRPYVGDILVVMVVYCMVRIVIPYPCRLMPFWVFVFAAAVECLQYFNLVTVLGVEDHTFLRILIGSTFDWKDILCYGIGCILLSLYEWIINKGINYNPAKPE